MALKALALVTVAAAKSICPDTLHAVYADMHDGDQKEVTISGASMVIKPSGNNQTWVVNAEIDAESCSAMVDFNVPGKPGPPPVPLKSTLWYSAFSSGKKTEFEFTDPSGTLADKTAPLNRWVELQGPTKAQKAWCPQDLKHIYADMHDGDKKEITIDGTSLVIRPSGNKETWTVKTLIDRVTCTASVDFNVPGKPGPPPVSLQASLAYSFSATRKKTIVEFTDPSGTLAKASFPLNEWVDISTSKLDSDFFA
mmetsp:Transcript_5801/g.6304  ORF Transcript_5801/g.6304 Transcript_5801/m.6304 type:complete len:253 (-) Transcript_5801:31-789(-)